MLKIILTIMLSTACVFIYSLNTLYDQFLKPAVYGHSNINEVESIYLINLEKSRKRLERAEKIFCKNNLEFTKFVAVDGWKLPKNVKKNLCNINQKRSLTPGELGVFLSHLSLAKSMISHDIKRAWILEDDFKIIGDIKAIPKAILELEQIDPEWDILYTDIAMQWKQGKHFFPNMDRLNSLFGIQFEKDYGINSSQKMKKVSPTLSRTYIRYGLTSFILSKNGAIKFVEYFSKHPLIWPIDLQIHFIPGFRQYVMNKDTVTNDLEMFKISNTKKNLPKDL